jgi:hypothetical protein
MPNTLYTLTTNLTLESALTLDSDIVYALQQATLLISGKLQQFADDSAFGDKIQVAFGTAVNTDELQSQWQAGDLSGFPLIKIVAGNDFNGANGAYAIVNNRIYLSYEFLGQNQGNLGGIVALLLEEYGHYVDGVLNSTDALGDEGAIFASLVLGESLSDETLGQLKAENDAGVITIDGKMIAVEQAFGTTAYIQFGTSDIDRMSGISIDNSNNIYVTGWTYGNLSGAGNAGRGDVFIAKYLNSGERIWLQQFGTVDDDLPFSGISADSSGNIYLAGTGPIVGTQRADVYLWKYSASGTQLWSRRFGTSAFDQDLRISTDASGNVLITGRTQGSFPGFTNSGGDDVFIAKYLSTGTQFWIRQFGTFSTEWANGISADSSGNVYVSGYTQGSLPGNSNLGGRDAFLVKYSGSGSQLWVRQFGTSGNDTAVNNTTDSSGNIYVAGYTVGTLPSNSNLGGNDGFLAKYSTSGSQLWVRQFGTAGTDFAQQVITDSSGNVYLAGYTLGSFSGYSNAGSEDVFVAKYSPNGTQLWVRQFGTSASDIDSGLSIDSSGNIYLSGYTMGSLPGNSNAGSADVFIIGIHPNGRLLEKQPVNLSVSSNTGTEAGSTIITVTITTPNTVLQAQTVDLTVSGSASPTDYILSNSTITIPTGSNVGTVTFTVFNDTLVEPTETAILTIGNLSSDLLFGTTISQTITIISNDFPRVNLSLSSNTGSEAGTTVFTVTATTTDPVIGNQTVDLAITGTGITSGDYNLSNSTITILDGQTTGTVTFTVVDDALVEGTETATLTLTNPSSGLILGSTISQAITLTDNDFPVVNLSISSNAGTEAGTTVITITATTTDAVIGNQTVDLAITGTGITSGDYNLSNSTITILNGQTTGTVTFTVVDDALVEGTETATLTLTNPSSGLILGSTISQAITLTDNDFPVVNLSISSNAGTEAGTTVITITATTTDAVIGNQTVDLAITGTGITSGDYNLSNSTITILNGQTTGTVTFTIVDDALVEGTETATLTLTNPSSGLILGSTISQAITLTDNDFAPPEDGNFDGIPDDQQDNVLSLQAPNNQYVTFAAPLGQPSVNVQTTPNPDPANTPPNVDFSLGFFAFNLPQVTPGDATTITLFLPQGSTVNSYWKYGPTPDNPNPHWYDFTFDSLTNTGAIFQDINSDGQNEIILHFVDGQRGDEDLTANGEIIDPGAPAFTENLPNTPPTVLNPITDVNVNEDSANTVIDLTNVFSDVDGDVIVKSVFVNNNPGLVTATIVDNQLTLDYQDNQSGIANLTIRGTSNGKTVDNSFTITVASVNDAPTLQQEIANQTATENQPFSFTIPANTFTDIDGDNLTYTLAIATVLPSGITFDAATGTFSGTPSDTASGTYNLTVIASDSAGEKANDSFSLNVLNVLNGSSSSETVNGTSGDDHINAGAGNDTVNGGEGNDITGLPR